MKQILVGIFFFLVQHAIGQNLLQTAIHTWVADQELREAGVGIAVIDTDSRQLTASWNPNSLFSPASSLKVLTTS
ncbi:hypothetical protein RZS08_11345, partial [Arthrospira platensis SPKY1]|nr:hypothetical protein [Arthrospira platensis SPKY1]